MRKPICCTVLILSLTWISGCSTVTQSVEPKQEKKIFIANTGAMVSYNKETATIQPKKEEKVFVTTTTGTSVTYSGKTATVQPKKGGKIFGASTEFTSINYVTDGYDYSVYAKNAVLPSDYKDNKKIIIKQNNSDTTQKDIYLKNIRTGIEQLFITLPDVIKGYKYSRENGNIYIIKQKGNMYELWVYDAQKKGMRVSESATPDFKY